MTNLAQSFIDNTMQCWSCPVFDRMFQVVSQAATTLYPKFVVICTLLFCVIFAFYIFGAVWQNITTGFKDGWFNKSVRPVFVNSVFALAFLGLGVQLPRFVTTVTFEPVAYVTQTYATAMIKMTPEQVDERVVYTPQPMSQDDGIFRTELRDTVINTAKVTLTLFQSFMTLGVAMIDSAFTWSMFFGVGAFLKHILLALIGVYLFFTFFKMFFRFLCYFADVIIAMAMFAFFFPFSIITAAFRDAGSLPFWLDWVKSMGKGVGVEQIKNLISAIVSLGVAVITYTVILVIMAKFFTDPDGGVDNFTQLLEAIINGNVFELDLDSTGITDLSITSIIVLVYVLGFIYDNIPKITSSILQMFNVTASDNAVGKQMGNDLMNATKFFMKETGKFAKIAIKNARSKK
ncbi:MAG: hypothetical protein J5608_00865 [Alphaproteobacteria bacterium]|nr:hypothetical protein [Alphaproteobacteria bacterium]